MSEAGLHRIDLLGNTVAYEVRRSSEATKARIDVDIHGVTVVIPRSADTDPEAFLRENAAWVIEKQRGFERYRDDVPERSFEAGERFPFLGTERELVIEPAPSHSITEDEIVLRRSSVEQSTVKQVLENFYRQRARERFVDRADYYAERMGVEYEKIEVRNQRTKWGSCSSNGTLGLNWRLMMAPPEIVDYVVVHELAHLREPDHSSAFWALVSEYDPSYEDHADWLGENSAQLIFSEADL